MSRIPYLFSDAMKPGSVFLNSVCFMKRFLLSSLLLLAMGGTAFATWLNTGTIQVPPNSADLIQVDDANFVNTGTLSIDLSVEQNPSGPTLLYSTSDTLNFTNSNRLIGKPGFDFE